MEKPISEHQMCSVISSPSQNSNRFLLLLVRVETSQSIPVLLYFILSYSSVFSYLYCHWFIATQSCKAPWLTIVVLDVLYKKS